MHAEREQKFVKTQQYKTTIVVVAIWIFLMFLVLVSVSASTNPHDRPQQTDCSLLAASSTSRRSAGTRKTVQGVYKKLRLLALARDDQDEQRAVLRVSCFAFRVRVGLGAPSYLLDA